MTLQNRVTPWGEVVADPHRGAWLGNRGGCFHDERQRLRRRRWATKQWITCLLEYKGWHREVMQPGLYTELFFLDEATALSAGHRPCYLCRCGDALRFREAVVMGNPELDLRPEPAAPAIDAVLHGHRLTREGEKRTYNAALAALPDGAMVAHPLDAPGACLVLGGQLYPWSFAGYGAPLDSRVDVVTVLTPQVTVGAIRAGYEPQIAKHA